MNANISARPPTVPPAMAATGAFFFVLDAGELGVDVDVAHPEMDVPLLELEVGSGSGSLLTDK